MGIESRYKSVLSNLKTGNHSPQILVLTSGKGGVGKTSMSINLAILLRQLNMNVLLIDADVHLGNVDLLLGIRPDKTVRDVILGEMDIHSIIIKGPKDIDVMPASSAIPDLLDVEDQVIRRLSNAFAQFEHKYDAVVVDTGSGISRNVISFVLGADKVVVVVTPDPASIADAYGIIKVIRKNQPEMPIMLIANMVSSDDEGESLFKKMNLIVQRFLDGSIYYGGAVMKNTLAAESVRRQQPIVLEHPNSIVSNSLKLITRRLLSYPFTKENKSGGFFERFMCYRNVEAGGQID